MNDDIFHKYCEAGRIAAKILREGAEEIRIGTPYLAVVETIESRVTEEGAGLAFPLNLSINEDAAHDTASPGDSRIFAKGDVVKLDLGIHIDGYIADTAMTVDLGTNSLLVEASRAALDAAIRRVRPGVSVGDLGSAIQYEIESRGYRPVSNLTGHGLGQYVQHRSPTIPNVGIKGGMVLEEGMVFAIEPFATTGSGRVMEKTRREIYSQISPKPVRIPAGRAVLEKIRDRRGLPFSRRWVNEKKTDIVLPALVRSQVLRAYPVLSDIPGSLVSQAEHTIIVTTDGCIVTTG
ncbi:MULTISPECIES: type II methionyl aminopeptidase [unclassified Methanoregula]|uniref:type II methionyl aminopeptidase n=1 Tax=unclassified Methanoregula TaxID=2649730 RepID=UPI0009CB091F|nr:MULTISPECIES: type II methionyl aminopeptidase [unclassified Methanoregula]OPX61653.1 MAG: Methionine aminopeptidase [Methanoregula sp. PtaB.Bin085]OPY34038.1 MAG: Methionine aminopeptidase [Methanoregula sp. PtaU1.Bin006]